MYVNVLSFSILVCGLKHDWVLTNILFVHIANFRSVAFQNSAFLSRHQTFKNRKSVVPCDNVPQVSCVMSFSRSALKMRKNTTLLGQHSITFCTAHACGGKVRVDLRKRSCSWARLRKWTLMHFPVLSNARKTEKMKFSNGCEKKHVLYSRLYIRCEYVPCG